MDHDAVLGHVREALAATLEEAVAVGPETNLVEEGILDSLDGMRFLFEIEKRVNVLFPEEDLDDGRYFVVENIVQFILEAKRSEVAGG
ncbi:MAG TPA: acyl carrier protein [Myxococcota bacterium]|nr:acyl carrier protein [Myxococcota bacterium]